MGGNAIKTSIRIRQEDVETTLQNIFSTILPIFNLTINDVTVLGSTGKKLPNGSSGDIDIAISITALIKNNKIKRNDIFDFILSKIKNKTNEIKDMRQMGLLSVGWPIIKNNKSNKINEIVQLDLMLVDSIEWSKWAFYSPAEWESPWKGLYRNEILYSIAKYMDYKPLEQINGIDVRWERNFFDLNNGLMRGIQTNLGKKGIIKQIKTLDKYVISNNPDEVVKMMFGDCKKEELLTWENTLDKIKNKNFLYKKELLDILYMTRSGIINKKQNVPKELDDLINLKREER